MPFECISHFLTTIITFVLSLFQKNVDGVAQESYDSISLFLCLHLCSRFRHLCRRKGIAALDKYWDILTGEKGKGERNTSLNDIMERLREGRVKIMLLELYS